MPRWCDDCIPGLLDLSVSRQQRNPVRALALDHFFDQDLQALAAGMRAGDTLHVLPYQRLLRLAKRYFPESAFSTICGAYADDLRLSWARYEPKAVEFADWLLAAYRPTIFVAPNDSFFYLRPVIARLRASGVATAIVQKETTIAPYTMEVDSREIARCVPPLVDVMTVCSERHREFQIRCGAPPESVIVTGQPRFDVYATRASDARDPGTTPTLLYLSFDDLAYLPADAVRSGIGTWAPMRKETERVIREVAESGLWRVVAKVHPQQQALKDVLGSSVTRAPSDADTRELIREATLVVGFQTTALFEAALAGDRVVYAAWGETFERARPMLIPYEDYPGLVTIANSPEALRALLSTEQAEADSQSAQAARNAASDHLGPVDGLATARVLEVLIEHEARTPPVVPKIQRGALVRAWSYGAAAPVLAAAGVVVARLGFEGLGAAAARRADQWRQIETERAQICARSSHARG
jgi:hypothetical protein